MIRPGQVWIYQRLEPLCPPVVHVVTVVDGDYAEATTVFTDDGKASERVTLSGRGCGGIGIKNMLAGHDAVGIWKQIH